jgi:hypothetical protein
MNVYPSNNSTLFFFDKILLILIFGHKFHLQITINFGIIVEYLIG